MKNDRAEIQNAMHMNFVVIDRRTAWDIFLLNPPKGIDILDREEIFENRNGVNVDYRNVIFASEDKKTYLLTGASYVLDPTAEKKLFSFFLYSEERWSDDESEPVSCPEMIVKSSQENE